MALSSLHDILGQKLYEGTSQAIYSLIDQPHLICVHQKDDHDASDSFSGIAGSRRSSIDSTFRPQQNRNHTATFNNDSVSKGVLVTSITTRVYEILREASIPTFYVASHAQPDIFIAKKCTMIPILWIIRRIADEKYVKRNSEIPKGHRFVPPIIEIFYKRHPIVYKRSMLGNIDDLLDLDRDNPMDEDDADVDERISSLWSYEQLLNTNISIDNVTLSKMDIEYMYEICSTVFDVLEHVWTVEKKCHLIDLKIEFGITTTASKEIVVANIYDVEAWHLVRSVGEATMTTEDLARENLMWINNSLKDILHTNTTLANTTTGENKRSPLIRKYDSLDLDNDKLSSNISPTLVPPMMTNRCVIVCSSMPDIEHGQKIKTTLTETYHIQCDIRLVSIFKSTQTILKFLSNYSYEHCRHTVFVTLGSINNGLAMCLSSNSEYPIIHCSISNKEQQNNLIDANSFMSNDTSLFTVVFTLSSAIQNVVRMLAMSDWKLWAKQRGRRFKKYMDLIRADQQLSLMQPVKTNGGMLMNK